MKNLLLFTLFVLVVSGTAYVQCLPNSGDWGQDANSTQEVTPSLAYRICHAAQPALYPYTEMTTPQLYNAYQDGEVVITYLGTDSQDPHKSLYRVSADGGTVIVTIIETI